jgi:outer membrane protein OmpA-like peptidoglycan-associated protein
MKDGWILLIGLALLTLLAILCFHSHKGDWLRLQGSNQSTATPVPSIAPAPTTSPVAAPAPPTVAAPAPTVEAKQALQAELNKVVELEIVEFQTASAELTDKGKASLDRVVKALASLPGVAIEVQGHTDNRGDATRNLALSQARAQTVKRYLVEKAIAEKLLSTKGFGPTKPKADNATAEGRARNRRIEFQLL